MKSISFKILGSRRYKIRQGMFGYVYVLILEDIWETVSDDIFDKVYEGIFFNTRDELRDGIS